jgi:hypothetical protein
MLKITLPLNRSIFNSVTVVTTSKDEETKKICRENNTTVLEYDCCFCEYDKLKVKNKHKMFNLSKMINQGLMYIYENYPNQWVLYLNSDIILDSKLKNFNVNLDKNFIYGCRRCLCPTNEEFLKLNNNIDFNVLNKIFPDQDGDAAVGVGFFQLFNKVVFYDQQTLNALGNYDASYTDLLFAKKFKSIAKINDYYVLHLGMPHINWSGRVSERWKS